MQSKTTLIQTSPEELADLIDKKIKDRFESIEKSIQSKNADDELLTREEACQFLQINPATLWRWNLRGKVKSYGISGKRRYYKRSELIEALKPLQ